MEDDDMFDGWMIVQRKKRDAQRASKQGDDIRNEKIRNSDEVYLMADTADDAKKVARLNDDVAAAIRAQRLAHLRNRKEVAEMEMPDTWSRFQGELAKMQSERLRAGKH
jgi:hypothetical protein